jgi:hypothetical protein
MAAALGVFKQQAVENVWLAREREEERARAAADKRATLIAMAETIETEASCVIAGQRERLHDCETAAFDPGPPLVGLPSN